MLFFADLKVEFTRRPNWEYDLSKSLEGVKTASKSKPKAVLSDDTFSSFVTASFVFKNEEGKAGETCQAQLTIISDAFPDSAPVQFNKLH